MTNGEMIKEIFPNSHIDERSHTVWVGYEAMSFRRDWWNAEYKEPITKNAISNKSIIYKAKESKEIQEDLDKLSKLNEPTTKNDLGVDCVSRTLVQSAISKSIEYKENSYQLYKRIESLPPVTPQEPQSFKWCTDCKEYDQEKHCCHRWSKVIRDTVEEIKQEQEPKTGHWKLVQRGKNIDVCCSNCEAVRIKTYAYNYTIDQLDKEDLEECFECADMQYCPNCGSRNEVEE